MDARNPWRVFLDVGAVPFELYGIVEFSTIDWTLRPNLP
jgi:hypothetical protein